MAMSYTKSKLSCISIAYTDFHSDYNSHTLTNSGLGYLPHLNKSRTLVLKHVNIPTYTQHDTS